MKHVIRDIRGLLLGLVLLAFSFAGTASAAVSARTVNEGGKELVVIANDSLELTFEPARGGRCVRFVFRDNGEQIIGGAEVSGMFLDHWAKYPWPSGLMWLPYEAKIVGDGTTRVGVQLQLTVPAKGGGKGSPSTRRIARNADLAGPGRAGGEQDGLAERGQRRDRGGPGDQKSDRRVPRRGAVHPAQPEPGRPPVHEQLVPALGPGRGRQPAARRRGRQDHRARLGPGPDRRLDGGARPRHRPRPALRLRLQLPPEALHLRLHGRVVHGIGPGRAGEELRVPVPHQAGEGFQGFRLRLAAAGGGHPARRGRRQGPRDP